MKSFIIALLPGLEEETGEYFEKVILHPSFVSSLAQPPCYIGLGTRNSGSVIRDGVALVFPAKRLADHVDESTKSWDSSQLPCPQITTNHTRRRYLSLSARVE